MTTVKRCGLYIRVSDIKQVAGKENHSLDTQKSLLLEEVARRNRLAKELQLDETWQVVEVYQDIQTAKDDERPRYQVMIRDLKAGRINMVLAIRLDRIIRRTLDFLEFARLCADHNAGFMFLRENIDMSTPQGKLMGTLYAALAEFEREQISKRVRDKREWQAKEGLWPGGRIQGYDPDPEHKGRLVINPEEADLVRFIYRTYLKCGSILQTAETLNARGYRTKVYTSRRGHRRGGFRFCKTAVAHVLRSPVYVGKVQHNGELFDGKHEVIVPQKLWNAVQKHLAVQAPTRQNTTRPRLYPFYLEGLVRCGQCDSHMTPKYCTSRNGKEYFYYQCTRNMHQGKGACDMKYVPAPELDNAMVTRIKQVGRDRKYLAAVTGESLQGARTHVEELSRRRKMLEGHLRQAERKINAWGEAMADADKLGAKDELLRLIAKESKRRQEIEAEIARIDLDVETAKAQRASAGKMGKLLVNFGDLFDRATEQEKRWLVRLIVHKVIWKPPQEVRYALYPQPEIDALPPDALATQCETKDGPAVGALRLSDWLPKDNPLHNHSLLAGRPRRATRLFYVPLDVNEHQAVTTPGRAFISRGRPRTSRSHSRPDRSSGKSADRLAL